MKILCISHGSTLNGAERSFLEMLEALSMKEHELYAIFPDNGALVELCKPYLTQSHLVYQPWWSDRGTKLSFGKKIKTIRSIEDALKYFADEYINRCTDEFAGKFADEFAGEFTD